MGTSTGYTLPTTGNWPDFKRDVTTWAASDHAGTQSTANLLNSYVNAYGGAAQAAQQMATASRAGAAIAGFVAGVQREGLAETLRQFNLGQYVGQAGSAVLRGIRDLLLGPNSLIEQDIVQHAYHDLFEESLGTEYSFVELERLLVQSDIDRMLQRFYGFCILRQFMAQFYERLKRNLSVSEVKKRIADIKEYIFTKVSVRAERKHTVGIDWSGNEGQEISQQILQSTWSIFGVN